MLTQLHTVSIMSTTICQKLDIEDYNGTLRSTLKTCLSGDVYFLMPKLNTHLLSCRLRLPLLVVIRDDETRRTSTGTAQRGQIAD